MANLSNKDLINMIDQSAKELHQRIDFHRSLVASVLDEGACDKRLKTFNVSQVSKRERKLRDALKETIEVLEQTKKAFKSKRLEVLRKKLTHVLVDAE